MDKYFYFRNVAALGDDDAATDSIMIPVANIMGVQQASDTTLDIFFESENQRGGLGEVLQFSKVTLTVKTAKRRELMEAIASATNNAPHEDGIITVADDVTGVYLTSDITAVASMTLETNLTGN
tara:strand:+ start:442 stop:813 length:372 start_codon:yes stop_codon:yes gene_type:complete